MVAAASLLCACSGTGSTGTTTAQTAAGTQQSPSQAASETTGTAAGSEAEGAVIPKIDMTAWQYNADQDVYWQVGVSYCTKPADESYETLGIYVPGPFMNAQDNGDGTYTCAVNPSNQVAGYTALTAPIVIPVNTPGYSAMDAPTAYDSSTAAFTDAGFIYLYAGCRGRNEGAPAGVTDLKAAIRYFRYNGELLPGDKDSIFSFGMSGGGAQSALLGSTGNSDLYEPYLEMIGAVTGISDAVKGSMCWCPITNLDQADAAYEWNMGMTREGLTEEEATISDRLAASYADYINSLGLKAEDGTVLELTESADGICQAGSYYEYVKSEIERSLSNFLNDTDFPYDTAAASEEGFGGPGFGGGPAGDHAGMAGPAGMAGGPGEHKHDGKPQEGPDTEKTEGTDAEEAAQYAADGIGRNMGQSSGMTISGTFETPQAYIDALNAEGEWVRYDAESGSVTITSVTDFVTRFKNASKSLGAFDQLDAGQGENTLFGYGDGEGSHFDSTLAGILSEIGHAAAAEYADDLTNTDIAVNSVDVRLAMYTPLYYLNESYEGFGSSDVADYWRIRTGINQSDTALCTELNLALALEAYEGVQEVDFETVWGKGHTMAERSGSSDDNFITWVNACMQ